MEAGRFLDRRREPHSPPLCPCSLTSSQDSFQGRFFGMNVQAPPRLLELGAQSLLRNEALAIMALVEFTQTHVH